MSYVDVFEDLLYELETASIMTKYGELSVAEKLTLARFRFTRNDASYLVSFSLKGSDLHVILPEWGLKPFVLEGFFKDYENFHILDLADTVMDFVHACLSVYQRPSRHTDTEGKLSASHGKKR